MSASKPIKNTTEFQVDENGTLTMLGFYEPQTHRDAYEDQFYVGEQWTPTNLLEAMNNCAPLYNAVSAIHEDYLAKTDTSSVKPNTQSLDVEEWLKQMSTIDFTRDINPLIQSWFDEDIDWSFEIDYLPATATAQGAAKSYFESLDPEILERLGVVIVEGDHPGSSYFAAELIGDINTANTVARKNRIPVRFISSS